MKKILVDGNSVTMDSVWSVSRREFIEIQLASSAKEKMLASRKYIESRVQSGEVIYGVNTGFGAFSSVRIDDRQIEELQRNLIRSHSVGVGELFSREQVRAIMYLRANALATGRSGIRPLVVERLLEFLQNDIIPAIPQQGSVGASGDLAPLSHLALALIGEGEVLDENDRPVAVGPVLAKKKIEPLSLQAKEGLALINGCQVMTAVGLLALYRARNVSLVLDAATAMSLEALRGTRSAFDPLISSVRRHPGEAKTASNLMRILTGQSEISESHQDCGKVQDAYSLRCTPAVHGAAKDTISRSIETLTIEANSSTDNPLVFVEEGGKILSCGNFHGEPVAMALDFAAIAVAELGSISECRTEKMINPAMSGLPAFLAPNGGLNSGHMITHVVAAALASENKVLAHPASVDSIPTSADKEDHVSMGTIAARKFEKIVGNVETIASIELLAAAQGLDLLKPLKSSPPLESLRATIRKRVPFAEQDRIFGHDIRAVTEMVRSGEILLALGPLVSELQH